MTNWVNYGGTVNNANLAMMTALGTCPAGGNLLASIPFITINEVTTVSAVTALQQFMAAPATVNTGAPSIGAPTTAYATGTSAGSVQSAVVGMNNAFVTAAVLADPATGASPNTNYAYATPESAKINTIADILAFCINSDPKQTTNCSQLMSAATPSTAGFTAADTIQAAWYMAQNPTNNLTNLYNFVSAAGSPFQPTYLAPAALNTTSTGPATNAFNDTTIAINYAPTVASTPAVGAPYGVAIDAFGNAWIANQGGIGGAAASAAELGVDGSALITPATTYTASATNGSTGQFTATPSSNVRTFATPRSVAIDLNNRAWIANYGDSATVGTGITTGSVGVFTGSTGSGVAGTNGGSGSTGFYVGASPAGVAVDGSNNVFVLNGASQGTSVLDGASLSSLVSSPGTSADGTYTYSTSTVATAPDRIPGGGTDLLAIDTNSNVTGGIVWASDSNACKITGQFNAATYFGTVNQFGWFIIVMYNKTYVGQTITALTANITGIAVDRNNGVWLSDIYTSNLGFDGLTYITAPTASTGIVGGSYALVNGVAPTTTTGATPGTTLTKAGGIAVDGNNNAWIANQTARSVVEATFTGTGIALDTPGQGNAVGSIGAAYGLGFVHNTTGSIGIAVDPSGNVWVANTTTGSNTYTNQAGGTTNIGNSVTVIVGAAGPVVTPLSLAIKSAKLGAKP